jgi:adenosine deaminase
MTALLHVHLEPGIRKANKIGMPTAPYRTRNDFFRAHEPGAKRVDRTPVSLTELGDFLRDLHREQRRERVSYAEVRLSPQRFVASGLSLYDTLHTASKACLELTRPDIRLILLINRNSSSDFVESCTAAVAAGLPEGFVGVDLAGDEVRFPDVARFRSFFSAARAAGLGVTAHAGEFGAEDSIWKAIDELGACRIGHAVTGRGSRRLARRLADDGIVVEACVAVNLALQAVRSLADHPLPWFLDCGVAVCVNTDVPLHIGSTMDAEWELVSQLVRGDRDALLAMRYQAERNIFRRGPAGVGRRGDT